MSFSKISALAGVLSLASSVAAHGHVNGITTADGNWVGGWDLAYAYTNTPPAVAGWTTKALDNGFVAPSLYVTSDIACHLGATAGKAYATVAAGSTIDVSWDTWPESHHGPVIGMFQQPYFHIDYLLTNDRCSRILRRGLHHRHRCRPQVLCYR